MPKMCLIFEIRVYGDRVRYPLDTVIVRTELVSRIYMLGL